jgi:hypothetical protein
MSGDEWFEFVIEELRLEAEEEVSLHVLEGRHQKNNIEMIAPILAEQEKERWIQWLTRWVYCPEGAELTLTDIRYARVFADKAHKSQGAAENSATFIRDDEELARAIARKLNRILEVTRLESPNEDSVIAKALMSVCLEPLPATAPLIAEPRFLDSESFARIQQTEAPKAVHLGRLELLNACKRFLKTEEIQQKVERYSDRYATAYELSPRQAGQLYSDLSIYLPFFKYATRSLFPLASALLDTFQSSSFREKSTEQDTFLPKEGLVTNIFQDLQSIFPMWKFLTDLHGRHASNDGNPDHNFTVAHALVKSNSIELVEEYLLQGGDVNAGGPRWTLLQAAVSMHTYNSRMHKILELLLERGAYVTLGIGEDGSALRTAAMYGKWVLLEKLLVRCLSSGAWKISGDLRFILAIIEDQGGINPDEGFSEIPASEHIAIYAKRQIIRIVKHQIREDEQEITKHL